MGVSKFHELLLTFYGKHRLRYVYLVRDPRDVAMSFMNTPVGDKHYYAIVSKWCKLQEFSHQILHSNSDLVLVVRYESLLLDKLNTLNLIHAFLGKQTFQRLLRMGSVQELKSVAELTNAAKDGSEAQKAAILSSQFRNLVNGDEFAKQQHQKWRTGANPLSHEELQLIESIAFEMMITLHMWSRRFRHGLCSQNRTLTNLIV